jgi:hypothetical protein
MGNVVGARIPVWYRVLAVLGLLWNCLGAFSYLRSVGMLGDQLAGLDPAHLALARSIPAWVTGTFAVAVFAGLLGSLLMVAGKRLASPVLLLSLVAVIIQSAWVMFASNARAVEGAIALLVPACITLVAILLVWLAAMGAARGWLD